MKYKRILKNKVKVIAYKTLSFFNFSPAIHIKEVELSSYIPKKIYQTGPCKDSLPEEIKNNICNLQKNNPDWEYHFYDNEAIHDYLKTQFPELLGYYLAINPKYGAARADFFRYVLMYNEGGCYLDLKSTFRTPIDGVIGDYTGMILSHWEGSKHEGWGRHPEIKNPRGEFLQCYLLVPKGHPSLKAVIENMIVQIQNYKVWFQGVGQIGVLRVSGPIIFTKSVEPLLNIYSHKTVNIHKLGYVYSIYKDSHGHTNLFKKHYSLLDEPIIL